MVLSIQIFSIRGENALDKCTKCGGTEYRVIRGECMACRCINAERIERRKEELENLPSGNLPKSTPFTIDDFMEYSRDYKKSICKI